jgi:CubicO group peptidase (beta-lactamase class C family)
MSLTEPIENPNRVTRRTVLRATTVTAAAASGVLALAPPATGRPSAGTVSARSDHGGLIAGLEERIEGAMARYAIPGVAVGLLHQGRQYLRGFGVTNVDHPTPVDADTVFRIGSTTKTFTGTTVMQLVEQGRLTLDTRVRRILPDLRTADPSVAARVTVRQLLNHSAGWLGEYYQDFGDGDDALTRYAAGLADLPQLTPVGITFAYNNAAVALAGRIVETLTGRPYEWAVRDMLIDRLGMTHTRFFTSEITDFAVADPHYLRDGRLVVDKSLLWMPRTLNPTGGLLSSVRDQLRYARFHLGDGTAPNGRRLLSRGSLAAMRSWPGPGGTLQVELDGVGVNWMLRPSAEGVRIVQHGGSWAGQYSGFLMVPERGFALTVLTNSEGGPGLIGELFTDDWALRRFAGVNNLPAHPRRLGRRELAPYEGRYLAETIGPDGAVESIETTLAADQGELSGLMGGQVPVRLAFYRPDYVLLLDPDGRPTGVRANFLRDRHGRVSWLRMRGRLNRRTD